MAPGHQPGWPPLQRPDPRGSQILILDASVALAWSHRDEATDAIDDIMDRVAVGGALVPHVWPLEIANGLQMAVRRKRITVPDRDETLSALRRLRIEIQAAQREHDWGIVVGLAHRHDLTTYDASYLALALERKLELATLDDALIVAARAEGLAVLP